MDFALSPKAEELSARMWDFMREEVFPAEAEYYRHLAEHGQYGLPPVVERLKESARGRGLWNLFLPAESGLSNVDYAALAEISGWSPVIAPEAINCQAPDTGNMEVLHLFGTDEQKQRWLEPLLAGEIRSAFCDDRAGRRLLGRDEHPDGDPPRRRRVRHQRPQVVDQRRDGRALRGLHRHGQDRPGCRHAPPAVDDPRAARHPGADHRAATCRSSATTTSTGTPRSSSATCGCRPRTCSRARATGS